MNNHTRLIPQDLTPAQRVDRLLQHGYTLASIEAEVNYQLVTGTYVDGWADTLIDLMAECDARVDAADRARRQASAWRTA